MASKAKDEKKAKEKAVEPVDEHVDLKTIMPEIGYDDMTKMDDMTEETLLKNIRERYMGDVIYTYSTSILVSLNPYKQMKIYTLPVIRKYVGLRIGVQPPHIYAITEASYTSMKDELINISVLVSGESGAGKTEGTKFMLRYLAARIDQKTKIEDMLLATIPVLESMGNARTIRNYNSSRFGKYIKIQFDENFLICGSKIKHYLLEKSRLTAQAEGERNFHIWYNLTNGTSDQEKAKYHIGKVEDYTYLNQSGCSTVPGLDEKKEWASLKEGLLLFDITPELQDSMFKVLSAVIHLGNVEYSGEHAALRDAKSEANVGIVAEMLGCTKENLATALHQKRMTVRNELVTIQFNAGQAKDITDALAKSLYAKLFDWLVRKLNEATFTTKYIARHFIGLLDIFGFEDLKVNSFEQLLINFANEKLQQFFNQFIFKQEQEEYTREGINWSKIQFKDNQECLDLIEKRPLSILCLLDEECKFPKATEKSFVDKLSLNFSGKHPNYEPRKLDPCHFKVKHYAGDVIYDTKDWLDKNRDEISDHLMKLLKEETTDFVKNLFVEKEKKTTEDGPKDEKKQKMSAPGARAANKAAASAAQPGRGKKGEEKMTRGAQFKNQLQKLMDLMAATRPFFVRCIKPNGTKSPDTFKDVEVMDQLRYAGMIETIRIRRMGYPIRYIHKDFFWRYKCLVPAKHWNEASNETAAKSIIPHLNVHQDLLQFGKTKVFMKQEVANQLDDARLVKLTVVIIKIQAWFKMRRQRNKYNKLKAHSVIIESVWKMKEKVDRFVRAKSAALSIQCWWRVIRAKKALAKRKQEEAARRKREEEERQRRIKEIGLEAVRAEERRKAEELKKQAKLKQQGIDANKKTKEEGKKKKKKAKKKRVAEKEQGPKFLPNKYVTGYGWSVPPNRNIDFDLACLQFEENGALFDVAYYNKLKTNDGSCVLKIDNREGSHEANEICEEITVDNSLIDPKVVALAFVATCYSDGYTYAYVKGCNFSVMDATGPTPKEFASEVYDPNNMGKNANAQLLAISTREEGKWRLIKLGAPKTAKFFINILETTQDELDAEGIVSLPDEGRPPTKQHYRTIKGEEQEMPMSVNRFMVGLGWLGNEDLDLSALCFRYGEFIESVDPVINRTSKDGSVVHSGDRKTGSGKGDDERLYINLQKVEPRITTIMILVNLFKCEAGGFNRVKNAYVRLMDDTNPKDRKQLCIYDLCKVGNRSAQITCKLHRFGAKWVVTAMGEPSYGFYYEQMVVKMQPFLEVAPPVRKLSVTVHGENGLYDVDKDEKTDPYWVVNYDVESIKCARIKRGNTKTVWEQTVEVTGMSDALDVTVYNHSRITKSFLGIAHIPLTPIIKEGRSIKQQPFALQSRGRKTDKVGISGEIVVSVSLSEESGASAAAKKKAGTPSKRPASPAPVQS